MIVSPSTKEKKTLDLNLEKKKKKKENQNKNTPQKKKKKKTKPKIKPLHKKTGPPPRPEKAPRLQGARHGDGGHVHRRDARDHGV